MIKNIKGLIFRLLSKKLPFPVPHHGGWLHGWRLLPYIRPYEPETVKFLTSYLTKDMTVADVGANVGFYTLLFSKYAKQVIAFEPETLSFSYLKKTARGRQNVEIRKQAVGKPGTATIYGRPGSGLNSLVNSRKKALEEVEVVSLPDVDFAKIDVEGYELEVLRNMKKIPCLVEYAPDHLPSDDYINDIKNLGYTVQMIDKNGELKDIDVLPTTGYCNLFLEPV